MARALLALLFLTSAALAAQERPLVYTSGINLVPMTVTVQQSDGQYVEGLAASQLRVLDEGTAQPISIFDAGAVPLDLVVLLDTSSSMHARLPAMQAAASQVLKSLRPMDRATILTFGVRTAVLQPFTSDQRLLHGALAGLACRGVTSLYDAMYVAFHEFGTRETDVRRRAIIVFTDGDDTASLTTFDSVLEAARRRTVATYTVRLMSPDEKPDRFERSNYELRALATETGAKAFTATGTQGAQTVVGAIAGDLTHQYFLGFEAPSDGSGKFRRVSVAVALPNVIVRTRSGYFADSH